MPDDHDDEDRPRLGQLRAVRAPDAIVQLTVRMPELLRARLERSAKRSKSTLNNEVIGRIMRSFDLEDLLAEERERVDQSSKMLLRFADLMERLLDELTVARVREMRDAIKTARESGAAPAATTLPAAVEEALQAARRATKKGDKA
jgi:hypothetical protein